VDTAAPSVAVRRRAADAWAEIAQLEHASVASFARFTLQLMAVGAPPQLVAAALQAGLDEVAHARAAFGQASRFRGEPVGPGPLPLERDVFGPRGPADLAALAADTFAEGCVNETIGALEAASAAEMCVDDPDARLLWTRIAEEEARHGELAWAFVRWAIAQGGAPVRAAVRAAFDRASAALAADDGPAVSSPDDDALRRLGLLCEADRRAIRRRGFAEIVRPTMETLGM
jgi:hypothetical protein